MNFFRTEGGGFFFQFLSPYYGVYTKPPPPLPFESVALTLSLYHTKRSGKRNGGLNTSFLVGEGGWAEDLFYECLMEVDGFWGIEWKGGGDAGLKKRRWDWDVSGSVSM